MTKKENPIESAFYMTMGAVIVCSIPAIITFQLTKKFVESVSGTVQLFINRDIFTDSYDEEREGIE